MATSSTAVQNDLRLVAAGVIAGLLGVAALVLARPADKSSGPAATAAGWSEVAWPLPVDPWWPSKAFTCARETCGAALTLYVRAKIGFCNCSTGVADDEELERIGDFAVLADAAAPVADGRAIEVAWMKGRSRPYSLRPKAPASRAASSALLIGYNDRCDAIVATAVPENGDPRAIEKPVLDFLRSPGIMRWAELTLGL